MIQRADGPWSSFPAELSTVLDLGRGTASFRLGRA
jgi:hypothetical protein